LANWLRPNYDNFRAIVETLLKSSAIRIVSAEELRSTIEELLLHPERATALGARGLEVFRAEAGATDKAVKALVALLEGSDA
jgi:3-deoxy-D-manno-octulosonic-acid transferase